MNEAKRLLVLGEVATVQETCSAKQQDGSETQDAHTTGSPGPAGLTTPPAQLLQQPVAAPQPACSSGAAPVPHTTVQAMGRLFQPTHTDSVLDVKVGGWAGSSTGYWVSCYVSLAVTS